MPPSGFSFCKGTLPLSPIGSARTLPWHNAISTQGRLSEAIQEMETTRRISGEPEAFLGFLYARTGRTSDALDILRQPSERERMPQTDFMGQALIEHGLGNETKALDFLESAAEKREDELPWLGC